MKKFFKRFGNKIAAVGLAVVTVIGGAFNAFADTTDVAGQMKDAVTSGASSASQSIVSMLTTVAPIIIGIVVGVIVLTAGIKWIKKIRSNAA